jgi:hypothetical protein
MSEPSILLAEATTLIDAQRFAFDIGFPITVRPAYGEVEKTFEEMDDEFDAFVGMCIATSTINTVGLMRDEK